MTDEMGLTQRDEGQASRMISFSSMILFNDSFHYEFLMPNF